MTNKYLDCGKGVSLKMGITITGLFLLAVATCLLNIQQTSLAFAPGEEDNDVLHARKENITTDIVEFVSGIFAAILFVLSLRAYTKLKVKGMLFVSGAFGIFAARTIAIETRDLYLGGGESPALECVLSIMILMALALFFVAMVISERIKPKPVQPDI